MLRYRASVGTCGVADTVAVAARIVSSRHRPKPCHGAAICIKPASTCNVGGLPRQSLWLSASQQGIWMGAKTGPGARVHPHTMCRHTTPLKSI